MDYFFSPEIRDFVMTPEFITGVSALPISVLIRRKLGKIIDPKFEKVHKRILKRKGIFFEQGWQPLPPEESDFCSDDVERWKQLELSIEGRPIIEVSEEDATRFALEEIEHSEQRNQYILKMLKDIKMGIGNFFKKLFIKRLPS